MPDTDLAARMRTAAKKLGGSEALRKATGLSPDTFYRMMVRGQPPRTMKTMQAVARGLRAAHVSMPRDLLDAA